MPAAFWSTYWRSRVPDARDVYRFKEGFREEEEEAGLELLRAHEQLPYKSGSCGGGSYCCSGVTTAAAAVLACSFLALLL